MSQSFNPLVKQFRGTERKRIRKLLNALQNLFDRPLKNDDGTDFLSLDETESMATLELAMTQALAATHQRFGGP